MPITNTKVIMRKSKVADPTWMDRGVTPRGICNVKGVFTRAIASSTDSIHFACFPTKPIVNAAKGRIHKYIPHFARWKSSSAPHSNQTIKNKKAADTKPMKLNTPESVPITHDTITRIIIIMIANAKIPQGPAASKPKRVPSWFFIRVFGIDRGIGIISGSPS